MCTRNFGKNNKKFKKDKLIILGGEGGGGLTIKNLYLKSPRWIQTQFYVYPTAQYSFHSIAIVPVTTFIFGGACVIQFSKSNATPMFMHPVLRIKSKYTEKKGKGIPSFQFSYVIIFKRDLLNQFKRFLLFCLK